MKKTRMIAAMVLLLGIGLAAFGQTAGFEVDLNKAGDGAVILKFTGTAANLTVPKELEGFPVKEIGARAFADNKVIRELTLPDTVEVIGDEAFAGSSLTAITIPASVKQFGKYIFGNSYRRDTEETWMDGLNYNRRMNGLSPNAALNLAKITFTGNRAYIPEDLFEGIKKINPTNEDEREIYSYVTIPRLTTLVFPPGLTAIPGNLSSLEFLTTVNIPDGVTEIVSKAFANTKLTAVTIPSSVTKIGDDAFRLTAISAITIPDSVTEIGRGVFGYCYQLATVTLPRGLTTVSGFGGCISLRSIILPDGVKTIGEAAFYDTGLETITLPAGLTEIGERAFESCKSLKNIIFPEGMTNLKIGKDAFKDCGILSLAAKAKLRQLGYTE